jgi:hypothetical protein
MLAAECLKAVCEPVHVSRIRPGNDVDVSRGAHDAVGTYGETPDDHVIDLRGVEGRNHAVRFEDRLSAH